MYEAIGLTSSQARLYEYLIDQHARPASGPGEPAGLGGADQREDLAALRGLGLVIGDADDPARTVVLPPDLALDLLIRRRESQLRQARALSAHLAERYRLAAGPPERERVEVVRGAERINALARLLEQRARHRLDVLSTPPYAGTVAPGPEELGLLGRGVATRVVYSHRALELEGAVEALEQLRAAGEQARIAAHVPMKLLLVDREAALVPLAGGPQAHAAAVVVRQSGLLDALSALFELLWDHSRPFLGADRPPQPTVLDEGAQQLLQLLAAGLKDQTVARHLGLSLRTVRRRISALMDFAGATTRFEAGYLLGRLPTGTGSPGTAAGLRVAPEPGAARSARRHDR
jgi:hypothetical protein